MLAYVTKAPASPYVRIASGHKVAIRDGVTADVGAVLVTLPNSGWAAEAWNAVLRQAGHDPDLLERLAARANERAATDPVYFTVVLNETENPVHGDASHNRLWLPVATFDFYF